MFDLLETRPAARTAGGPPTWRYAGPERRHSAAGAWRWLALALDEIDRGLLLVAGASHVTLANHVARCELGDDHPLQLVGDTLRVRHPQDAASLHGALAEAARFGKRRLLELGRGAVRLSIAVVPLPRDGSHGDAMTLLTFGKRRLCEDLSVQAFARSHGLTATESRVLAALCNGAAPIDVARAHGVALSTVRSQVCSIRAKTGAGDIRALVRQVAVLPPMVGALRGGGDVMPDSGRRR